MPLLPYWVDHAISQAVLLLTWIITPSSDKPERTINLILPTIFFFFLNFDSPKTRSFKGHILTELPSLPPCCAKTDQYYWPWQQCLKGLVTIHSVSTSTRNCCSWAGAFCVWGDRLLLTRHGVKRFNVSIWMWIGSYPPDMRSPAPGRALLVLH